MKIAKKLVAACAVLFAACAANAATLSYYQSVPLQSVPFLNSFNLPGAYSTISDVPVGAYTPALGTLVKVEMFLNTTAVASVDIFNATGAPQGFTGATATVPVTVSGPGALAAASSTTAGPFNGVANPGFNSFTGIPGLGSGSTSATDAPTLAAYAVAAPISLSASGSTGTFSGSSVPGVFFSGSADASGDFEIRYTYESAVPTPGAAVGGVALLGGMAALRRRRQA